MTCPVPVEVNGKYGFINQSGALVVEPEYDWAGPFVDGLAPVGIGGEFGYISATGEPAVPLTFDSVQPFFTHGLAGVRKDGLWGYVAFDGRLIVSPRYPDAGQFSEGVAAVKVSDVWGFIDTSGTFVVEPRFADVDFFSCGLARGVVDGKKLFVDRGGVVREFAGYADIGRRFREDRIQVQCKNGKWGIIDKEGVPVAPCEYDGISEYYSGYAVYYLTDNAGYLDRHGTTAFGGQRFGQGVDFCDEVAAVQKGRQWYVLRKTGECIGPVECERLSRFHNGFSRVVRRGLCGFIDTNAQIVVSPRFERVDDFEYGLARVEVEGATGYVTTSGTVVWMSPT